MATAWGEVCRQCLSTVAEIPIQILLVTIAATLLGLFVLVSTVHLPFVSRWYQRARSAVPIPDTPAPDQTRAVPIAIANR